jgi:DNA-directed RNA polymerase subunit RPC12/RpoP
MRRSPWFAVALGAVLWTPLVLAGALYNVTCSDPGCGFKASVGIGGGFKFEKIRGFCKRCNDVVGLTWPRGKEAEKPKPLAEFWDPKTGEVRQVFKCPKCGDPFVAIQKIEDLQYCPKCNKPTLKRTRGALYD